MVISISLFLRLPRVIHSLYDAVAPLIHLLPSPSVAETKLFTVVAAPLCRFKSPPHLLRLKLTSLNKIEAQGKKIKKSERIALSEANILIALL